jgi:probable addiction module antidote protein
LPFCNLQITLKAWNPESGNSENTSPVLDAIQIMPTRDYKESLFEDLEDPEFVVAYLNAALEEGTQEVFLLHLRDVADAWGGLGKLATETSLAREALYRMLSEHGNPQLSSLEKILQVLGLRLAVTRTS